MTLRERPDPELPDGLEDTLARATGTDAERLLARLDELGWTLAVAESLTGGLVVSSLVEGPGASRVLRGAVVAQQRRVDPEHRVLHLRRIGDHGAAQHARGPWNLDERGDDESPGERLRDGDRPAQFIQPREQALRIRAARSTEGVLEPIRKIRIRPIACGHCALPRGLARAARTSLTT